MSEALPTSSTPSPYGGDRGGYRLRLSMQFDGPLYTTTAVRFVQAVDLAAFAFSLTPYDLEMLGSIPVPVEIKVSLAMKPIHLKSIIRNALGLVSMADYLTLFHFDLEDAITPFDVALVHTGLSESLSYLAGPAGMQRGRLLLHSIRQSSLEGVVQTMVEDVWKSLRAFIADDAVPSLPMSTVESGALKVAKWGINQTKLETRASHLHASPE